MAAIALQDGNVVLKNGNVSCSCCPAPTPLGLLASATSAGGGLGCAMGPAVQTFFINPPYYLEQYKTYILRIVFNSGDALFHKDSYYEANYTISPDVIINWTTTYGGTSSDPWSITNNGKTIRYSLEDSENCGGSNNNIQTGTAEAYILNLTSWTTLGFSFTGSAELQAQGFENIQFYLDLSP